jgi:site-specific DNA recombinase
VLVHSPDRLSRKYAYLILILEELERWGVEVLFLEQPPGDDPHSALLVQIQGAVAEYDRAKTLERYRRGKLHCARQGEIFWWSVPFGYRHIPRRDAVPAHVVVDEAQAALVRNIFRWHADEGMSIRKIAKRLTREGHSPPRGGKVWGDTTAHKILRNEAYIGTLYYNRSHLVPLSPGERSFGQRKGTKNKLIIRPREEWISVSIPSIIDRETFQRSQARHEPNRQFSPRRLKEERWLLRGLLRCANCKHKHACVGDRRRPHMQPAFYYRCGKPGTLREYVHCRPNHLRSEPLDELVWQEIRRHLLDPQLLLRGHKQLKDHPREESFLEAQIQAARRRLQQTEAERRRLLDAFQGGFLQKQEFEERAHKLSERITGLDVDLKGLQEEEQKTLGGKHLLSRIADFTRVVRKKLDTMSSRSVKLSPERCWKRCSWTVVRCTCTSEFHW